jgi:hypothetical protein
MKNLFLLLILAIFFTNACRSETIDDTNSNNTAFPEFQYNYGNTVNRSFFGQVLDRSGNPVSGAALSIGTSTVQTNSKGFFLLKNVSVKEKFAQIKATKSGFVNASRVLLPTNGDNRINIMMIPATTTATVNSGATSTVSLPDGTSVKFDGSFKNENGSAYTGSVKVALFNLKTSDTYFNETMPGSLLAGNSQGQSRLLESYGMMHVQLTGDAGQNLQIADNHTAEITSPIDTSQLASSPNTIPLWSFDENSGIWREEGSATKVGNKFVGNVKHFSWWNCDVPQNYATLNLTVTNSANQPIAGVKVGLSVANQSYEVYGYSDNLGHVSGFVPPNQLIIMKVYNQCNAVVYTSTIGPFTGSSNILTITVPTTTVQNTVISGTLVNCAGTNVTNGFVELSSPSTQYFQSNLQLVNNGNFSFSTLICGTSQQFSVTGYDITTLQYSGAINFTANPPITNIGNIMTCNTSNESITFQLDNQPVQYCISNFSANYSINILDIKHNGVPIFEVYGSNFFGVGSYSTGYQIFLENFPNGIPANGIGNNLTVQISYFGAIGDYIDFTVNGTFVSGGVTHTISATGHVLRDS